MEICALPSQLLSELRLDPSLLQNRVGGESLARRGIDGGIEAGDWAVPDFMIALAMADKSAALRTQYALQLPAIAINHQAATGKVLS